MYTVANDCRLDADLCADLIECRNWSESDSQTDIGSETASAYGHGCERGSVVRIDGLMRTLYFRIRTTLVHRNPCASLHIVHGNCWNVL